MTVRPEVVALLTDFDVKRTGAEPQFAHRDGRPFTEEEADLVASATDEEMRAAAGQLTAAPQRLAELLMPYIRASETGERPPDGGGSAPGN